MRKSPFDTCTIDGCDRPFLAIAYCKQHYRRFKKWGDPLAGPPSPGSRSVSERIAAMTDYSGPTAPNMTTNCWIFTGSPSAERGQLKIAGRRELAPRIAWALRYGDIPLGLYVCHRCDVPRCIRPEHLFLGSAADNTADMMAKGRQWQQSKTECKAGHAFTETNTYVWKGRQRRCRKCAAEYQQARRSAAQDHSRPS